MWARAWVVVLPLFVGCSASAPAPLGPVGATPRGCEAPPTPSGPAQPSEGGLGGGRSVLGTSAGVSPELEFGPSGTKLTLADRVFVGERSLVYAGSVSRAVLRTSDGEVAVVTSWDTGTRLCGEVRVAERAPLRGVWLHAE